MEEFVKFVVAEHLYSPEVIVAYLREILAESDKEEILDALKDIAESKYVEGLS